MSAVLATLTAIDRLLPPRLHPPAAPPEPDLAALAPLAGYMSGDHTPVVAAAHRLSDENRRLEQVAGQADAMIAAARADLLALAEAVLRLALPLAIQALSPGQRATAEAQLADLSRSGLEQAESRTAALTAELEPVAGSIDAVTDESADTVAPTPPAPPAPVGGAGQVAVDAALSQLGKPYVWGGTGPDGYDCSGLVQWAYRQAGVELPRTAEEMTVGTQVTAEQLQPGDLAVWDGHVAMYIGDGQMVEAGDPVQTNPVRTSNMSMAFQGFWRPTAQD